MSHHDHHDDERGVSRRKVLECMTWAGTGVLWTISGGVPRSLGLVDAANAAEPAIGDTLGLGLSDARFRTPHARSVRPELSQYDARAGNRCAVAIASRPSALRWVL